MYREAARGKVPHGGGMLNASQWDEKEGGGRGGVKRSGGRGESHDTEEMREEDKS